MRCWDTYWEFWHLFFWFFLFLFFTSPAHDKKHKRNIWKRLEKKKKFLCASFDSSTSDSHQSAAAHTHTHTHTHVNGSVPLISHSVIRPPGSLLQMNVSTRRVNKILKPWWYYPAGWNWNQSFLFCSLLWAVSEPWQWGGKHYCCWADLLENVCVTRRSSCGHKQNQTGADARLQRT